MESTRKLLEGERVEVRQKEVGLRGSWHSGVVVRVKSGRRVVEYDELFTLDGSKKLRELIPLTEEINVQHPASRHSSGLSAEHNLRGFIRPIPPPRLLSSVRNSRKGLLVDAFYDCAWWEGILLHDVLKRSEASKVKIFFPEEGDELSCYAKDVRVSQEWDEGTGQWTVRGIWPLCGDNDEFDLDHLRSICRQRCSSLKKLWRQRNCCEQASLAAKEKNSTASPLESQGSHLDSGNRLPKLTKNQGGQRSSSAYENKQSKRKSISRVQEKDAASGLVGPGAEMENLKGRASFVKHSASMMASMEKSRSAAKKYLLDSGWKIVVRTRTQGISQGMKEAIYTAPNGAKYYSLASACRGWKKIMKLSGTLEAGVSQRLKILDAYSLAEQLMSTGKQLKKAKTGQRGETCKHKACEGRKPRGLFNSVGKSGRGSGTQSRDSKLLWCAINVKKSKSTFCTEKLKKMKCSKEQTEQKSKSTPCKEKLKKRKCNEEGTEQKCKKGRSSIRNETSLPEDQASHGRGGWRMQVLLSSPHRQTDSLSAQNRTEAPHFKRSTVLSWLIDKGIIKDNEPVGYLSRKDGHVMKKGEVTREGVRCKCCRVVFTLSNFEAHAGSKLHRPSANIFLDDGRSLTDCQLQACAIQDTKEDSPADISDDTCGVCADGGELILCDNCPSTFHPNCIGLEVIPDGVWYCPRCLCGGCSQNKMAGDDANTLSRCDQCELGYHSVCAPETVLLKPIDLARGAWFCSHQCEQLFRDLRNLVGKANCSEDGFSWMLLRSMKNDVGLSSSSVEIMAEHNVKLGVAHDVMQECFIPMVDPHTKIDLISQALYNRKSKVLRLNYGGFYTIILEKGDEMISVAAIRVHGCRLAEMPLVGTRYQYRRQGMCRRLMQALEQMLGNIGVEKLVLPAVPELLETWTGAFNFQHMTLAEMHELSRLNLMTFPGTTFLQKQLKKKQSAEVIHQLVLPEKANNHDGLACKSTRDLLVGAGAIVDGCVSDTFLSRDSSQDNSFIAKDMLCLNQNLNIEGFYKPTPLSLESTKGLWSNSLCDYPNDGKGKKNDDVQYARVVRATTRSKRLVKSSKWIADGLRELAKDIESSSCNSETGDSMHKTMSNLAQGLNLPVKMLAQSDREKGTVLVASTNDLAANSTNSSLDEPDTALQPRNSYSNLVDDSLRNFLAEARFIYSTNHYVRRRKTNQQERKIDITLRTSRLPSTHLQSTMA